MVKEKISVPYCLPLIDEPVVQEVHDTLVNTGWLTTGPKVRSFEAELATYCGVEKVLAVNSWNSGAQLILRWYGIKPGDEVIIPAYTYSATALAAINLGATVKMVDVGTDFNITVENIKKALSSKTKVVIPVDIGGLPCDYFEIEKCLIENQHLFMPAHPNQEKLGRVLMMSDAAHSIGAEYLDKKAGAHCDVSVFSFHSVKNITTGEGGAVCLNLPKSFDNTEVYNYLKHFHLYGQTKSALDKTKPGSWKYDIVSAGMKANMNDVSASIGLSQLRRYESDLLPHRKKIFQNYLDGFKDHSWAQLPTLTTKEKKSSAHLFMMRFKDISEKERDELILYLTNNKVGTSVHYIPMASFTYFKSIGYDIKDYPVTYKNYAREITLPVYNSLNDEQVEYTIEQVIKGYKKIKK